MANIKSQIKRIKTNKKREERNKDAKSALKTYIARFEQALEKGQEEAKKALDTAVNEFDRAASKGIIHKNNAANKKSSLMKKYNAFVKAGGQPVETEKKKVKKTAKKRTTKTAKKSTTTKKTTTTKKSA